MNSKFSVSITSEPESLSLSRYRAPSDTSSMQQYDVDPATYPQKMEFKKLNAGVLHGNTTNTTPPNPFGQQAETNELHTMFVRQDYQPTTLSAVFTICGLAAGIGIGVLLSKLEARADVVSWVALPGELYLDALICVVVPGVFCSVIVAVSEVVANATVRKVAMYSALWFTIAALLASAVGTAFAAIFSSSFEPHGRGKSTDVLPQFAFKCASNTYLTMANNGTVMCGAANESETSLFTVKETDAFFELRSTEYATVSLTSQVVGILSNMIPSNIFDGFVDDTYVSVIFSAFFFAIACTFGHDSRRGVPNYLILIVSQAGVVFRMIINVLLKLLPVAVISLVGGSIGNNKSSIDVLNDVVYLVLGMIAAAAVFIFVVLGIALFVMTKRNVLVFVAHMLPAQAFVLGCSSTMATLPMTIRCVDNSNEVPRSVSRIVLPFAATCNLTGMSLYIPLAVVFLAKISGFGEELTAGKYVLLWLLSAIASFGASTVEHSEMVMVITIWRAILNRDPGDLFATLVVTDWLLQRLRTLVNVTSHAILARIVAEHCHDPDLFKDPGAFLVDSLAATPESARQNHF